MHHHEYATSLWGEDKKFRIPKDFIRIAPTEIFVVFYGIINPLFQIVPYLRKKLVKMIKVSFWRPKQIQMLEASL
jgi:hypothetical protein